MTDVLLVITTLPDEASAQQLAEKIIAQRAAACINRLAPCTSTYRWQGAVETATEVPLLIKTTRSASSARIWLVGVVMGSGSDWPTMSKAVEVLAQRPSLPAPVLTLNQTTRAPSGAGLPLTFTKPDCRV